MVTLFSTVAFGDITPVTEPARIMVTVQITVDLLARLVLDAVQVAVARRARTPEPEPPGAGSAVCGQWPGCTASSSSNDALAARRRDCGRGRVPDPAPPHPRSTR